MGLRSCGDPISEGERAFLLASTKRAVLLGETPVKVVHISSKKEKGGNS